MQDVLFLGKFWGFGHSTLVENRLLNIVNSIPYGAGRYKIKRSSEWSFIIFEFPSD